MLIVGVVLCCLLLLLLCPVRVHVTLFDDVLSVRVSYLIFSFLILPAKENKKAKKPKKKKEKKDKQPAAQTAIKKPKKKWDSDTVTELLAFAKKALQITGRAGKILWRGLHIKTLKLEIMTVGKDAATAAENCGKLCIAVYSAATALQMLTSVRTLYINIYPGFWQWEDYLAFEGRVSLRPVRLFWAGGALLFGLLPELLRFAAKGGDKKPKGQKNAGNKAPTASRVATEGAGR